MMMKHGFKHNVIFSVVVLSVLELSSHPRNNLYHNFCARLFEHGHEQQNVERTPSYDHKLQEGDPHILIFNPLLQVSQEQQTRRALALGSYHFLVQPLQLQKIPACSISPVQNNCLGILKNLWKFLPAHQTWNKFDATKLVAGP